MSKKITIAAAAALPLALLLAGCAGASAETGGAGDAGTGEVVRIGVVGAGDPYWETYKEAAAAEGIEVELVDFSEYTQPNPALSAGELDLNQFQHVIYLATYNVASDDDLQPIGATAIYPLGLYSSQYDSVADIPAGATVAVPNDESNQARGLLVLQSAGLIELKDGGSIFSTVADVEPSSKVKVEALDAALTATSLPDVAAAIINNDFVADAGLSFEDAIAVDDPSDPNALPYVNIFAARAENVAFARQAVLDFAADHGIAEPKLTDLRLAISEAVTRSVGAAPDRDVPRGRKSIVEGSDSGRGAKAGARGAHGNRDVNLISAARLIEVCDNALPRADYRIDDAAGEVHIAAERFFEPIGRLASVHPIDSVYAVVDEDLVIFYFAICGGPCRG